MSKLDDLIQALPKKVVATQNGPVEGYIVNGTCVFKGIPYAAAPEGALRWSPPRPRTKWTEPLNCTKTGEICFQNDFMFPIFGQMGEDCLNLNIWTPEKTGKPCPVMVWLHGGGFTTGTGSLPTYDGGYFASLGIVSVTLNYRLNVHGFFAHPELAAESGTGTAGNYGIMDQLCALQWVRDNIINFGGDPANVTVFGESAGGASVAALMSSPLAAGLFHRAIAQSPGYAPYRLRKLDHSHGHLESAVSLGRQFVRELGLTGAHGVIDKMRKMPAVELSRLWFKVVEEGWKDSGAAGSWMLNHLIIDGHVLTEAPGEVFRKGKQHNVPFMVGTTADEGTLFEFLMFGHKPSTGKYRSYVQEAFGKGHEKVITHFGDGEDDKTRGPVCNLLGSFFQTGARRLARSMSAVQPQTYRYLFTMPPRGFIYQIPGIDDWQERLGVYHAAEIPFVFHFLFLPGYNGADHLLADQVAGYWARFAATGDPNGTGAPEWPRYSNSDEKYLVLDDPVMISHGYKAHHCDCMEEVESLAHIDNR